MIESFLKLLREDKANAKGLEVFSELLLSSTLTRSLAKLDQAALASFTRRAFQRIVQRPHQRHAISFATTGLLPDIAAQQTVIEILNDDMPFVVESVIAELHAEGLIPQFIFHPIFKVDRDASGQLQAVVGPGDHHWASGNQESYIAVLLDPLDATRQMQLAANLNAVLDDVRAAAEDGERMRERIKEASTAYAAMQLTPEPPMGAPAPRELMEAIDFLDWLNPGNFTLLGIRDFEFVWTDSARGLRPAAADALGIARTQPEPAADARLASAESEIADRRREIYRSPDPLVFFKSATLSRVRHRVPLDCIGVKRYAPTGQPIGEMRLYGLFTPVSYMQPVESVPVVRNKVRRVLEDAQFPPDSHNGRTLVDTLENFPRDELLQIEPNLLYEWSMRLLDLAIRPRPAVLTRRDDLGRYTSALVFVPREHYSSTVRVRLGAYLADRLGGTVAASYPYISTSPLVRVHLIIATDATAPQPSDDDLEQGVIDIIKTWPERLEEALAHSVGKVGNPRAAEIYRDAFSVAYAERFPPERAVEDIQRIERLGATMPVAIDFYRGADAPPHRIRAAVYRFDEPIALSERVPVLENMGFKVIDESSYRIRPMKGGTRREVVLHDMELETANGAALDIPAHEARMEDVFLAVFRGDAESDPFNMLVVAAGLDWREAAVLRAMAAYLRQIRAPFSPRYVAETLVQHPDVARDLYHMFRARFAEPHAQMSAEERDNEVATLRTRIEAALGTVQSLDEDRILRRLLSVVLAIVRTNAFQGDTGGNPPAIIAYKFASREIDRLPDPKPYREIFVYGTRFEGVHLRFAPIARGGIRWSDRPQDYRTEVLSLAKAQQVKNTVIVPSGAKGGFVLKQLKPNATREEVQAEGITHYKLFIEALLSITDNIREGKIVSPRDVVRRDGDDPYLVVAADKGTATFSDYANAISLERGFWLGDAFASGGSAGYDHKRLGITARGAWECVKRHFREMDVDIQRQPFRVVGVGDMSGDVFGNGMLLSPQIHLVAAFDHRDIFFDPSPDPAISLAERQRLFALPRSSWADYDRAKISAGGGVFSRALKAVPLSNEMRQSLGIDAARLTPAELIQAILRAEVDLLWFGGIGTFVRETSESDEQVGDRTNDALRVSASELRVKVVGEGANLGLTQRARIEAARNGIRLNTDFIDNSAGVNTSDQEVNIKIALAPPLASGRLALDDRNRLLAAMTGDITTSVLANNHAQGLALSLAERASRKDMAGPMRLTRYLEERGLIDRKLEALPTGTEFNARAREGKGLTRPELAVLLSWAKIALDADLLASSVPDEHADTMIFGYFPPELRTRYAADLASHPLRREIVATSLTNTIVNSGGPDIVVRLAEVAGEPNATLAEAYLAARAIFDIDHAWRELDSLDGRIGGSLQLHLYEGLQDLSEREALGLVASRAGRSLADMISAYRPAARELMSDIAAILPPARAGFEQTLHQLREEGVPENVALRHASLPFAQETLALADHAAKVGADIRETARVQFAVDESLHLADLRARVTAMAMSDEFDKQLVDRSLAIVEAAARTLADRMLADPRSRGVALEQWVAANAPVVHAAGPVFSAALAQPGLSAARLALIADALRDGAMR